MGSAQPTSIGAALFGRTKQGLLALLFSHPERSFYLREIIRQLGAGQGSVQRELARFTSAGLVIRSRLGSQVHYQANKASPVFAELRGLMVKSAGVGDVLREALRPLGPDIRLAFVYGSMARGEFAATSDVDLMAVGDASFGELVAALQSAQQTIGREVNPSIYSAAEFREKLRAGHHFLNSVLKAEKFFVVGDEHELGRLAESKLDHAA